MKISLALVGFVFGSLAQGCVVRARPVVVRPAAVVVARPARVVVARPVATVVVAQPTAVYR